MKYKRVGLVTKLVVIILMVYATVTLINLRTGINEAEKEMAELEMAIQGKNASIATLQYEIEHCSDPKTIENIAREKLGLLLPGERVFYDISN